MSSYCTRVLQNFLLICSLVWSSGVGANWIPHLLWQFALKAALWLHLLFGWLGLGLVFYVFIIFYFFFYIQGWDSSRFSILKLFLKVGKSHLVWQFRQSRESPNLQMERVAQRGVPALLSALCLQILLFCKVVTPVTKQGEILWPKSTTTCSVLV